MALANPSRLVRCRHPWLNNAVQLKVAITIWAAAAACGVAGTTNTPGEDQFLSNVRQLVFEGRRSGEGYFSPDGKALIFQSEREPANPFYQIYILNFSSGKVNRVSPGAGKTTCAFFRPGHDEVLFASTHLDPEAPAKQKAELEFRASGKQRRYSWDYDETMDIFSARRDGSRLRRLTSAPGYDAEAAYSPDGRRIVFCSIREAYPTNKLSEAERKRLEVDPAYFGQIYIMDADGSKVKRLTHTPGYDGGPFFSPDGKRIVWRRFDESGMIADVYTMKIDGSDVRRITDFQSMSWAPYYHPSGKYIIFTSNKLGFSNFELHMVGGDDRGMPVRVTFTEGFDGLPVFSPDGKRLCWTSGRTADGKSQLFIADWNHDAALRALQQTSKPTPPTKEPAVVSAKPTKFAPEIRESDLRAQIEYLASDGLEGRMTGTRGAELAADFIAQELKRAGLQPINRQMGWFQKFEFTSGVEMVPGSNRVVVAGQEYGTKDCGPLSFTANGTAEGAVVFAGYGLVVPGKDGYDSYSGLDVSNKVVLALRYVPEAVEPRRRQELNRYAGLRYKAMNARERGARGILFVTGPNSPNAGELAGLTFDSSLAGSGILAMSISSNVAQALLAPSGKNLNELQAGLDNENPHVVGSVALSNVTAKVSAAVKQIRKMDRNVLGMLPGKTGKFILAGAHYDHLGFGEAGAMQRAGEEHAIHNGADDNASGVAALLEAAAASVRERKSLENGIIFAFWSGEEIGLIGSSHFAEHPAVALSNVVAYINFDMVGRLRENRLNAQGVGSSTEWRRLLERLNVAAGFNLVLQEDPYLPTDVTAFYPRGVPVLSFFTGSHDDYHRPSDDPAKINYPGLERIATFAQRLIAALARASTPPDYLKIARTDSPVGSRENLRAYLGTIPDYATEVAGVKLSGVRGGSPAEKAGLKGGDIIVEFAGTKIANIYDYTYALDAVKIGQRVDVVVVRDGKQERLSVTPEARGTAAK
jgi:Tol biopolymer transport system component